MDTKGHARVCIRITQGAMEKSVNRVHFESFSSFREKQKAPQITIQLKLKNNEITNENITHLDINTIRMITLTTL